MRKSKKLIFAAVLVAVMIAGSLGGIAYAADNGDEAQAESRLESMQTRVSELYQEKTGTVLDWDALKESLAQAAGEAKTDALINHLQNLVTEGKITQEQADEYLEWHQARPDVQIGPGPGGMDGKRGPRGMGGMQGLGSKMMMRGFGGPGAPATE